MTDLLSKTTIKCDITKDNAGKETVTCTSTGSSSTYDADTEIQVPPTVVAEYLLAKSQSETLSSKIVRNMDTGGVGYYGCSVQ